jgi:hypothetical protein
MHLSPDPDFEEFALDCIRLSNQELWAEVGDGIRR